MTNYSLGWAMGLLFSCAPIRVSARIQKAGACGRLPQAAVLALRAPSYDRKNCSTASGATIFPGWAMGLEPTTTGATDQCSTIELRPPYKFILNATLFLQKLQALNLDFLP